MFLLRPVSAKNITTNITVVLFDSSRAQESTSYQLPSVACRMMRAIAFFWKPAKSYLANRGNSSLIHSGRDAPQGPLATLFAFGHGHGAIGVAVSSRMDYRYCSHSCKACLSVSFIGASL